MRLFPLSKLPTERTLLAIALERQGEAVPDRTEPSSIHSSTSKSRQASTRSASALRFRIGWILFLSIYIAVSFITGCGKKGPPVPPRQAKPPEVTDLKATIAGDTLGLTWTVRRPPPRGQAGFYVYRSKTALSEPVCETCPIVFQRIADIPVKENETENFKEGETTYTETLEKGYQYIYKVIPYMENEETGKDSNFASVTY